MAPPLEPNVNDPSDSDNRSSSNSNVVIPVAVAGGVLGAGGCAALAGAVIYHKRKSKGNTTMSSTNDGSLGWHEATDTEANNTR